MGQRSTFFFSHTGITVFSLFRFFSFFFYGVSRLSCLFVCLLANPSLFLPLIVELSACLSFFICCPDIIPVRFYSSVVLRMVQYILFLPFPLFEPSLFFHPRHWHYFLLLVHFLFCQLYRLFIFLLLYLPVPVWGIYHSCTFIWFSAPLHLSFYCFSVLGYLSCKKSVFLFELSRMASIAFPLRHYLRSNVFLFFACLLKSDSFLSTFAYLLL